MSFALCSDKVHLPVAWAGVGLFGGWVGAITSWHLHTHLTLCQKKIYTNSCYAAANLNIIINIYIYTCKNRIKLYIFWVGNCLGFFFVRLGIFFWILGWTRSVCYFQHFGVGNCYDLTYSQHFGVRCSLFPCYSQHFGRSVCYFQHFGVGNETVTTAAIKSKCNKAETQTRKKNKQAREAKTNGKKQEKQRSTMDTEKSKKRKKKKKQKSRKAITNGKAKKTK